MIPYLDNLKSVCICTCNASLEDNYACSGFCQEKVIKKQKAEKPKIKQKKESYFKKFYPKKDFRDLTKKL